jgi:hypothetical protein
MPGLIKTMIDRIIAERSKGNSTLASTTRTKLILKGIDPDKFGPASPDDQAVISKLRALAADLDITV